MEGKIKNEYVIINKTAIQKRIEELEGSLANIPESYIPKHEAQIYAYKQILSQSTSLISEIEKAFDVGQKYGEDNACNAEIDLHNNRQDYISNLKLDI